MKKVISLLGFLFILFCFNVTAFAGPLSDDFSEDISAEEYVEFEITGGIDYFDKAESTFDSSRTVTGLSEEGSVVDIYVYTVNLRGKMIERDYYSYEVGASGIFSQDIDLYVGENVIVVSAELDGKETVEVEATIKRKRRAIKTELQNSISLPGEGLKTMVIIK